jgi:hypothetical protein
MRLHSRLPPEPSVSRQELSFYEECLRALNERRVPFLLGGTYALKHYCGIVRETKDVDVFMRREDLPLAFEALEDAGFRTELTYPHWLAKAHAPGQFLDIIFNSGNGATAVDDAWFVHASRGVLLGHDVLVCPAEETIWSKSFVMERERYDGADVAHLFRATVTVLDWERLIQRFGDNWPVLLSHVVLFRYAFPREGQLVPDWVMETLLLRAARDEAAPRSAPRSEREPVCRGTMLSREQYLCDLEQGYRDARLPPRGTMSPEAVAHWTASIPRARP